MTKNLWNMREKRKCANANVLLLINPGDEDVDATIDEAIWEAEEADD